MQNRLIIAIVWYHNIILCRGLSLSHTKFRLKKTVESDLPKVYSLLASNYLKQTAHSPPHIAQVIDVPGFHRPDIYWTQQIEYLRIKYSFQRQLSSRFHVMKKGHDILTAHTPKLDYNRLLFSNDSFRWALENAGNCASELNAWTYHNFALTPEPSLLQHIMISASFNENLAGFCEVAMLSSPKDDNDNSYSYYPCIVNLIVHPMYRNQGLGTKMIQTLLRLIQRYWIHKSFITLYVNKTNHIALRLYEKEGFFLKQELDDKYYLTKRLNVEKCVHKFVGVQGSVTERQI